MTPPEADTVAHLQPLHDPVQDRLAALQTKGKAIIPQHMTPGPDQQPLSLPRQQSQKSQPVALLPQEESVLIAPAVTSQRLPA